MNYRYLRHTSHIVITPSKNNNKLLSALEKNLSETNMDCGVYEEDLACTKIYQNENQFILMINYHIIYSPTYQVPVLYFNAQYAGMEYIGMIINNSLNNHSSYYLYIYRW